MKFINPKQRKYWTTATPYVAHYYAVGPCKNIPGCIPYGPFPTFEKMREAAEANGFVAVEESPTEETRPATA